MRIFLDANVLFAAAQRAGGNSRALFDVAPSCGAVLLSSPFAVDEALRNLRLKAPEAERDLLRLIEGPFRLVSPDRLSLERARESALPEKDVPILAAAIAVRPQILVTGDRRHFAPLFGRRVHGVEILLPLAALERLLGELPRRK